jgi:hypothetical protein
MDNLKGAIPQCFGAYKSKLCMFSISLNLIYSWLFRVFGGVKYKSDWKTQMI